MENYTNLISKYKEAQEQLSILYEKRREQIQESIKKTTDIEYSYRDKIHDLEREKRDKIYAVENSLEKFKEKINKKILPYSDIANKVKHIVSLIDCDVTPHDVEVFYYSSYDKNGKYIGQKNKIYVSPIKNIFKDEFNTISLFIVPNGNSVNKYSLVIRGNTPFRDYLKENIGYGYINYVNESYSSIRITVKTAEEEQTLIDYANRPQNLKRILNKIPIDKLKKLSEEYKEAKKLFEQKEWKILYLKDRKYYYENHYSRGTETDEYKEVIKKLEELENK